MRLENWSVVYLPIDPYKAPEQCSLHLYGNVYGHPKFTYGLDVTTSAIVGITSDNKRIVTNTGSEYELGVVNPEYEKQFPDAKARLLKSLAEK